jgi:phosphotriesterase-related protein
MTSDDRDRGSVVTVDTVLGPIGADELGTTLMHEHILVDASRWWHRPSEDDTYRQTVAHASIAPQYLGTLRNDPFLSLDNARLDDERGAAEELERFRLAGGRTVVDTTGRGIGRDPEALVRIARTVGLNIIMGSGYYLETSQPPEVAQMTVADIAEEIVRDILEGVDGSGIRAGIIGEIGVSKDFTPAERRVLRAAARAQRQTHVPLSVHLPGWERRGGEVLDLVAEEGGRISGTILCHMNPSLDDPDYQIALAERGAWLEFDMIGMDFYYADQEAQSPCDEENARALVRLIRAGHVDRLLLSSDVFLKMMLVRHGGVGYAHILDNFVPRLRRHGVDEGTLDQLLIANPRAVFEAARAQ